jgi:hypothetical protein
VPVCNFCSRLGTCSEVRKIVCEVGKKFHPLAIPEDITPTKVIDSENTSLALILASVVSVWSKAFKTQVTDRILRREAEVPPGYMMATRKERTVADAAKMRSITLAYMTDEELAQISEFSRTKAAEIIGEKAPRGQKGAMVDEYKKRLISEGALQEGIPYSFLKVASAKKDENKIEEIGD